MRFTFIADIVGDWLAENSYKRIVKYFLFSIILTIVSCTENSSDEKLSLNSLDGKKIGVFSGTIYDKFAVTNYRKSTILYYSSPSDIILALKNKKVDFALVNSYSGKLFTIQEPELELIPLETKELSFAAGVGFNKNNSTLLNQFNEYLSEMKATGKLKQLIGKWFDGDPQKVEMPVAKKYKGKKIVLGVSIGDLPYAEFKNDRYVGSDIELVQGFAEKYNFDLEIVSMDFSALIMAVVSGKVDMIADGIAITDERKKQIAFSEPYFHEKSAFVVLKNRLDSNEHQMSLNELMKKKVGVLQGSVHDSYMHANYPDAQVFQFKSYPDLLLSVKSKKIDVGLMVVDTLLQLQKEEPSVKLLYNNIFTTPIAIGFRKGNDKLREEFNAFLKEIKASGILQDMIQRWYINAQYEMPVIENPKTARKLVVGNVSDKGLPHTVVKNGKLIGFDIELVERFAAWKKQEPVFMDMEFGNLIAAVSTNKVDMIASTVMITDERKKRIDFSDPYYELTACIFGMTNEAPANSGFSNFMKGIGDSFYSNLILEDRYLLIIDGLKVTFIVSIFSILIGTIFGSVICFLKMSKMKLLQMIGSGYIFIMRGIPVLVLLMIIFYVVFASVNIDPVLVAIIAFALNFAAYVSEMFRTAIESVDHGQTEAGIASGFTRTQTFLHIVMPQALQYVLPVYRGEVISLVKMTSIVGYIAVQDLTKASDIIRSRTFDAFFPLIVTAVLYFGLAWIFLIVLGLYEKRLDPRRRRTWLKQRNLTLREGELK